MTISGPSQSGKSTWVKKLLSQRRLKYDKAPNRVYWFYRVYQDMYDRMLDLGVVDEFHEGMPTMAWVQEHIGNLGLKNCTIVIDDLAMEATEDTARLFTVGLHHYDVNIIFLCQNLFTRNRYFREISVNSTYHLVFKNPRDNSSIMHFARQFRPGQSRTLAKIYFTATKKAHSYLFFDYHQRTEEENRIQSNILFENKDPAVI
ncbi:MAG: hypothetical protein AAFU03_18820, partial [Bacteroidota bacterium]